MQLDCHCHEQSPYQSTNIVEPELAVTILNNIVDNNEQCRQHNNVQSCSHEHLQCSTLIFINVLFGVISALPVAKWSQHM